MDLVAPQGRIDDVVEDGDEDDDGEWVEVVKDVVGDAVGGEGGRLQVRGGAEAAVVDVSDGVEEEDAVVLRSVR